MCMPGMYIHGILIVGVVWYDGHMVMGACVTFAVSVLGLASSLWLANSLLPCC